MPHAQNEGVTGAEPVLKARILLVDDDKSNRDSLGMVLRFSGFDVVTAADVSEALGQIGSQTFDVLLTDLHMPDPGDGLTVASAMRHSHPKAATFIYSGYPEMSAATAAILLQTDQVLLKPMAPGSLVETIRKRLKEGRKSSVNEIENVSTILERESKNTTDDWYRCAERESSFITVHLEKSERCAHLPAVFRDLVHRLRNPLPLGTHALVSADAAEHGRMRFRQGYTASMLVEESRMLQVSIFQSLQNNLQKVDFSLLLVDVMVIADEVDSQLAQAMASYIAEAKLKQLAN
ncbi:response regulator [Telmatobacter sp. DSM 110680]|uniref:Response regulator n=1 Tax=Telmatobacter sp. DSM 110680 TaxID=3036704 RepID=A0AAU7DDI5_9BACT